MIFKGYPEAKSLELSMETGPQSLLARIEKERFNTPDDPGIHGIKERLLNLGFVLDIQDCCSGHPEPKDFGNPNGERFLQTSGYLPVMYDGGNSLSASFHNSFRNIAVETSGVCRISFGRLEPDRQTYSAVPKFEELFPKYHLLHSEGLKPVNYQVVVERTGEGLTPQTLAESLAKFWQQVSNLINRYSENQVAEKLEPWYFGFRSKFGKVGKIEATHPDFDRFSEEVAKRQQV